MRLARFNALSPADAEAKLTVCCASPEWAQRLVRARPFRSVAALCDQADRVLATLDEVEIDRALTGHPRIGERSTHASSRREQAGVATAEASVLAGSSTGNQVSAG